MRLLLLNICLIWLISSVNSTHFRGGYISWQTLSANVTTSSTVTVLIYQTYSWANSAVPCGQMIGDFNYLRCVSLSCSNYSNNVSVRAPCTSYDLGLDVSTAQSTTKVTFNIGVQLVVAFQSSNWLLLVYGVLYPAWSLATYINLAVRTDNGRINSSPTSNMALLVTVMVNSQQTLRIPLTDIDQDVIKCRWATNGSLTASTPIHECGGVCQNTPNAQLYSTSNTENNCTLVFNTTITGYYVIALQIEDFMPSNPNSSALSSIPLQFLVRAVNITCNTPTIIGDLANGANVVVPANTTLSVSIIAQIGCSGSSITRFSTITIPSGLASTSTIINLNASLYSITFTWPPRVNQIGTTQLYCTLASADNNLQSAQYCLNFLVGIPTTTTIITTTLGNAKKQCFFPITCRGFYFTSSLGTTSNSLVQTLGLSLGLGLASLLFASLLSLLCCCRCCNRPFW